MAHTQQKNFCNKIKSNYPHFFKEKIVVDIGCLDVNGNNNLLFDNCLYLGVDIGPGNNVDFISKGHEFNLPSNSVDTVISTECFEHDKYYSLTMQNIYRMLKPGGLFIFTCATTGRPEHGTKKTTSYAAPLLPDNGWSDYYRNLDESDIREVFNINQQFSKFKFEINNESKDLYFWGFKAGYSIKRNNYSFLFNKKSNLQIFDLITSTKFKSISSNKFSVSVVIPYYNGSQWIERAIISVLNQSIQPDEFIIVNDGSNHDETVALEYLGLKYPFRIIEKSNGGQGSARNVGVSASSSQFISFLDQDDFYLTTHIEELLKIVPENDHRLGYVYADLCEADVDGNIVNYNLQRTLAHLNPKRGNIIELLRLGMHVLPSAALIYRRAFEEIGGFDEQFRGYEDDDLFLRMYCAGYTNYYLDKPVTVWCRHSQSTTFSITMSYSRLKYFKKLTEKFKDDIVLRRFYFRDAIAPHYGSIFISDAKQAIFTKSVNSEKLLKILCEYTTILYANKNVKFLYKLEVKLKTIFLMYHPYRIIYFLRLVKRYILRRTRIV